MICSINDCFRAHYGKSFCRVHYKRWYRYGDPNTLKVRTHEHHGMARTPEYRAWQSLLSRCYDPKTKYYEHYGARGIKVCDRWLNSFANFFEDMGKRPSLKHSIDRKDVNGDYSPDNCQWATPIEQANNTRRNRFITINGITKTFTQWTRFYDVKLSTARSRYYDKGKPIEVALGLR